MAARSKRIITKRIGKEGTSGASAKQRSEISGSFNEHARRAGVASGAGAGKKEHSYGPGWAGEVVIKGLNDAEKKEVLNMVRHTAGTGPRDPGDRVVKITDDRNGLRILTSENRLALSIGKRVHRSRKGGTLTITWSPGDLPVRVLWVKG